MSYQLILGIDVNVEWLQRQKQVLLRYKYGVILNFTVVASLCYAISSKKVRICHYTLSLGINFDLSSSK